MKILCLTVALMSLAAGALAQPVLTVIVTAPTPSSTWTFVGTATDPVALATESGTAAGFTWSTDVWSEFRIGWDLVDPTDPFDPGWTAPGYDPLLTSATGPAFTDGVHTLTVSARDGAGGLTRGQFIMHVVPIVPVQIDSWAGVQLRYR